MDFIRYNPQADLGWIMGDTLAKAGGLLYQNYVDRGEAKIMKCQQRKQTN